jgi:hypothetical protein
MDAQTLSFACATLAVTVCFLTRIICRVTAETAKVKVSNANARPTPVKVLEKRPIMIPAIVGPARLT